jgi:hypothetical protein
MRKIILMLLMAACSFNAIAQQETQVEITDSTDLIQIRYMDYLLLKVKEKIEGNITLKEWEEIMKLRDLVINQSLADVRKQAEPKQKNK